MTSNRVIEKFVVIIAIECNVVATLYACIENSARMWRTTFIPYKSGVSVFGSNTAFRMVGMKAITSMLTAIITDIVGSRVSIHGIMPPKASIRKKVSILVMYLNPYLKESRKMMSVKTSDAAVGKAPIPAPFASCPKKTIAETMVQTNHVMSEA